MNQSTVTFLLDRSGSMGLCKAATIEGFNAYLATLKAEREAEVSFTFLTFDTDSLDKVYVGEPVGNVAPLTDATYQPRGGTPLIDAAVKTIRATEAAALPGARVIVCLQTDGHENASTEHTWEELRALVTQKTAEGWEFLFMGAGIDAYDQGAKIGIGVLNTMSYNQHDAGATRAAFGAAATNSMEYASARANSTSFSARQRVASGDVHWNRYDPAAAQPSAVGLPAGTSVSTGPLKTRRQTVADFTLRK